MSKLKQIIEESVESTKDEVEREYRIGGLSCGLYGDYASDVAKASISKLIQALIDSMEEDKAIEVKNSPSYDQRQRFIDRGFNQALTDQQNKLKALLEELQ